MECEIERSILKESDFLYVAFAESRAGFYSKGTQRKAHAILEAAITSFNKKGLASATLDSIARESGRSKAVVRYHFKSLSEIRMACFAYVRVLYQKYLLARLHSAKSRQEALETYFDACLEWPKLFPHYSQLWLQFLARSIVDEELKQMNTKAVDAGRLRLEALIRDGMREGSFNCTDAAEAASHIHCLLTGFILASSTQTNAPSDRALRLEARRILAI